MEEEPTDYVIHFTNTVCRPYLNKLCVCVYLSQLEWKMGIVINE